MAADTLKSASITSLDATPVATPTTGEGAPGYLKNASDFVTPTTAGLADTTSTYRTVRLPANCKLKSLKGNAAAALDSSTGLVVNVGAYYSDSKVDGTKTANIGALISANAFSASNAGFKSSALSADLLNSFSPAKRNQPLWKALGLTANPGGFIDVVVAVSVAATTAVSSALQVDATYVE